MSNISKLALRNLFRYKRRTFLTLSLIVLGMVFVLVFVAASGSFKNMMIGQITDSFLGHIQIHRKGYLASIENLPLNLNLQPRQIESVEAILKETPGIEAYSLRLKFGGAFSNFEMTTNIRVNGVDPEREFKTCPLLADRILQGSKDVTSLERGKILVPELLAKGMKLNVGDTVVVVATNQDGSVNGKTFTVGGILESAAGPGGRDGYIPMEDAMELLRLTEGTASEIALRLKDFGALHSIHESLERILGGKTNPQGKPVFEVHTWEKLSPFYNIAQMIDVMTLSVKLMLISIVLISIMNVMVMAVYERVREIGTMAAMGTMPGKILSLFMAEGFFLGCMGSVLGSVLGGAIILLLRSLKITFSFARSENMVLSPAMDPLQFAGLCLLVIAAAVVASLQPAFKASRMDPVKALGHV